MKPQRDTLFAHPHCPQPFRFDDRVAAVFADMVQRSVPGYASMVRLSALAVAEYAPVEGYIYDLGCSLGAVSLALDQLLPESGADIVAVDRAWPMCQRLRQHLRDLPLRQRIHLLCADIAALSVVDARAVVLNLTLQFIAPEQRLPLLQHIYAGLRPGGVLLLSEKVHHEQAAQQQAHTRLHEAFKQAQGYSRLEISQKREALDKVLRTDTAEQHKQRLQQAGFSSILPCFQALNFHTWLAIKA